MAYVITQRMAFGGTNIDFPLLRDSLQSDDFDHIIQKDKAGGTIIYTRSSQNEWTLDIICTKTEADTTIRAWMAARSLVVFTPDLGGAPGVTHNVLIMNTAFPFRAWGEVKWRGTLILRKQ